MTTEEREKIKALITEQIERTIKEISFLEDLTKPIAPENSIGRISRMDAINNKSVNEAALRDKRVKLQGLESAIKKIDKQDFGKCIRCGHEIPIGRILLMPHATQCVKCS
ncbi:MAG: TraR/DksA family transcriptional regulator [Cytophagaceae bacterium]